MSENIWHVSENHTNTNTRGSGETTAGQAITRRRGSRDTNHSGGLLEEKGRSEEMKEEVMEEVMEEVTTMEYEKIKKEKKGDLPTTKLLSHIFGANNCNMESADRMQHSF